MSVVLTGCHEHDDRAGEAGHPLQEAREGVSKGEQRRKEVINLMQEKVTWSDLILENVGLKSSRRKEDVCMMRQATA